jgi:hypothetical protein
LSRIRRFPAYTNKKEAEMKTSRFKRALHSKRAASEWISWVLIMAFAVILSVFMYQFMVDYTTDQTTDIKKIVYNSDECRLVSININSACFSAQVLNITLQNNNYVRLDKIDFRLYNGRIPLHTNLTNITMNPNREKMVSFNTGAASVTMVEVIPHIIKEQMDIICSDKKAAADITC